MLTHKKGYKSIGLKTAVFMLAYFLAFAGGDSQLAAAGSAAGWTSRISIGSGGEGANDHSFGPMISGDGRFVAYSSRATNIVPTGIGNIDQIYLRDLQSNSSSLVSISSSGVVGHGVSQFPDISSDGRYIAFESGSTNLVTGDSNGKQDIFLHDSQLSITSRISLGAGNVQANNTSGSAAISAEGTHVAFTSRANNLVSGDTNGRLDIFVRDWQADTTSRVSVSSDGTEANANSSDPSISSQGQYVVYESDADNLVTGDNNLSTDIFVHETQAGITTRVSVDSSGLEANDSSRFASISANGQFVAFESQATNLISDDNNGRTDIFVHDRLMGSTERVSIASNGQEANNASVAAYISADGRFVTFSSYATNLVIGDTNNEPDIYLHDRETGVTTRVSVGWIGQQANNGAERASVTDDGSKILFESTATNLVAGDLNDKSDIFLRTPASFIRKVFLPIVPR